MVAAPGILKTVNPNPVLDGSFVFGDHSPNISNEQVVLAATTVELPAGTQMGKITASGLYVPINPAAADGSQNWAGTLWGLRPVSTSTQKAVVVARRCGVNARLLTYINSVNAAQRAAIEATMAAAGVVPRY